MVNKQQQGGTASYRVKDSAGSRPGPAPNALGAQAKNPSAMTSSKRGLRNLNTWNGKEERGGRNPHGGKELGAQPAATGLNRDVLYVVVASLCSELHPV